MQRDTTLHPMESIVFRVPIKKDLRGIAVD